MKVARVSEHPRITKPFSDAAWDKLNEVGHAVDKALDAQDLRLTMGGEPTFVSIDDFEGAEWNIDAVGPTKARSGRQTDPPPAHRFAPGGFLHYGQGKWYPGETLPRWTFSLYWRRDGQSVWKNPDLVAQEAQDYKATAAQAGAFMESFAEKLGIAPEHAQAAYEDPAEWILKEANLPPNVSPENSKLKDPEARSRYARVFSRGLTEPSGFILPIQRWQTKGTAPRGGPRCGNPVAVICSLCPATALWGSACLWRGCRISRLRNIPTATPPTPRSRWGRCRISTRI
jgi:uncharacterized protein (DUF2126 family)